MARLSVPQEIVQEAQSMLEKGGRRRCSAQQEHTVCVYIRQFGYASFATMRSHGRCRYGGEHPLDERSDKGAKLQYLLENLVSAQYRRAMRWC